MSQLSTFIARFFMLVLTAGWLSVSWSQNPALVVGHKNPDTDAIVSAIAAAELKTALGEPTQARAQGEPNPETRFVLERFGFSAPPVQTQYAGERVILVDHSDRAQAPDDLDKAQLVGIFDHHKLGDVQSDEPLEVVVMPVGSTATVLQELFQQRGVVIDPKLAGIMLGAILSDTRIFRSPTTTTRDRDAARILADRSGVKDVELFGRALLTAYNQQMKEMSDPTLLSIDSKVFRMGDAKVSVSQIEAFDIRFLKDRLAGLRQAMANRVKDDGLAAMILAITDVDQQGSILLAVGPQASLAKEALGIQSDEGTWKPGVMSRKKQIIPALERAYAK